MYWRMLWRSFHRAWGRRALLILTVAVGLTMATAALNISLDVGDKVGRELRSYGANIIVEPVAGRVSGIWAEEGTAYLAEKDLPQIKMIFWRNNIVAFAPFLTARASVGPESDLPLVGTWFSQSLVLPTGETVVTGVRFLKDWWRVDGQWPAREQEVLVGKQLAGRMQLSPGQEIELHRPGGIQKRVRISGILDAGGPEDGWILAPLSLVQDWTGRRGLVEYVEVSALTTPENDLARKAAEDPESLTQEEFETWYCTAYVSSIIYQLEEVLPGARAKALRQISAAEGAVLSKVQYLMAVVSLLALISAALGVGNLLQAKVREQRQEVGLLRALGASGSRAAVLFLGESLLEGLIGGLAGYVLGSGLAWVIGQAAFGLAIEARLVILPLVLLLATVVTMGGAMSPLRFLLRLEPAQVLRGG